MGEAVRKEKWFSSSEDRKHLRMESHRGLPGKGSNGYKSDKYELTARHGEGRASWADTGAFQTIEFVGFVYKSV